MNSVVADKPVSYVQRLEDLRAGHITNQEVADVAGVNERQVYLWANGEATPRSTTRDRLLALHYIVDQLTDVYKPEGVEIWLHSPNANLKGKRPIELIKANKFDHVLAEVAALKTGAF